jgi:hypothetical protein
VQYVATAPDVVSADGRGPEDSYDDSAHPRESDLAETAEEVLLELITVSVTGGDIVRDPYNGSCFGMETIGSFRYVHLRRPPLPQSERDDLSLTP